MSLLSVAGFLLSSLDRSASFAPSTSTPAAIRYRSSPIHASEGGVGRIRSPLVPFASVADVDDASSSASTVPDPQKIEDEDKVLVLGGSGFLGREIVRRLSDLGVPCIATSTSGADSSVALNLTAPDAEDRVAEIASGCSAVISTVGSIGTDNDEAVNAASGTAAVGAKRAGVRRFIFVGNAPRVRSLSKKLPFLVAYARGKERSEKKIRENFDDYCIIQPTFIYGGDEIGLNPPRVPKTAGQIVEDLLGLYPVVALAEALPGVLGVAMEAPVGVERVAAAAVNAALGLCGDRHGLEGREEIILAACKRRGPDEECLVSDAAECSVEIGERREGLKANLLKLGADDQDKAFAIMEELESLRPAETADNPDLYGRWDFVFNVEPDMGTGIIKEILEGETPIQLVFDLDDLHLEVADEDGKDIVRIVVATKLLRQKAELVLTTSFEADESDPYRTMFMEKFEGIKLAGVNLPVPNSWKRSRPLEFSYVDDTMMIARGNGGEPHFLVRNKP